MLILGVSTQVIDVNNMTSNTWTKVSSPTLAYKYNGGSYNSTKKGYDIQVIKYTAKKETISTKGTTNYGEVTSSSSSAYPNNDKSGSYWYVYKGIY